jgi:hypothetical protein
VHPNGDDLVLEIDTDPTAWVLQDTGHDAVAEKLKPATGSGPIVLPVVAPLQGRLVLSAQRAGAISFHGAHPIGADPTGHPPHGAHPIGHHPHGAHPIGVDFPRGPHPIGHPLLYLPSVTAAAEGSPVYVLDRVDLEAVERDIIAAMTHRTRLTLGIAERDTVAVVTDGTRRTLQVSASSGGGSLVLNGAALVFVVLAPTAAQAG